MSKIFHRQNCLEAYRNGQQNKSLHSEALLDQTFDNEFPLQGLLHCTPQDYRGHNSSIPDRLLMERRIFIRHIHQLCIQCVLTSVKYLVVKSWNMRHKIPSGVVDFVVEVVSGIGDISPLQSLVSQTHSSIKVSFPS